MESNWPSQYDLWILTSQPISIFWTHFTFSSTITYLISQKFTELFLKIMFSLQLRQNFKIKKKLNLIVWHTTTWLVLTVFVSDAMWCIVTPGSGLPGVPHCTGHRSRSQDPGPESWRSRKVSSPSSVQCSDGHYAILRHADSSSNIQMIFVTFCRKIHEKLQLLKEKLGQSLFLLRPFQSLNVSSFYCVCKYPRNLWCFRPQFVFPRPDLSWEQGKCQASRYSDLTHHESKEKGKDHVNICHAYYDEGIMHLNRPSIL